MAKRGRPSKYSKALAERICQGIAEGKSLVSVLKGRGMPDYSQVTRWLDSNEDFRTMYARAREVQADYLADQIIDIADSATGKEDASAVKVRVDARKWVAAKLKPRRYGDKTAHEHSGPGGGSIRTDNTFRIEFVDSEESEDK